jgi:2-dehydropantoate 2-reductase
VKENDRVRVVIAGAGALGSVLGGYFARSGAKVTLLARQAHAEAIRCEGLRIGGVRGEQVVRDLQAVSEPAEITSADLFILAVKSYDTAQTMASLAHIRDRVGTAISIQNGAQKDEVLGEALGRDVVVGAATIVGAAMPEPGRVLHTGEGSTWLGEFDGQRSARVEAIADLFRRSGLSIEVREDIRSAIWCKLNQMVPAATLACVTRLPLHQIYQSRGLAALFVELSHEVARVAERMGIPLVDCQGIPVRTLCSQSFDQAVESILARGRTMEARGMTEVRISTLQDLERGRRTEADDTIGHVVRLAAAHNVSLPTLTLLFRVIQGIEASQQSTAGRGTDRPA